MLYGGEIRSRSGGDRRAMEQRRGEGEAEAEGDGAGKRRNCVDVRRQPEDRREGPGASPFYKIYNIVPSLISKLYKYLFKINL